MSTVKVINVIHPSGSTNNIVNDASGNATIGNNLTVTGGLVPSSSFLRNRIINGDCRIDQRNAGASVTPTNGAYTLDRWAAYVSQASKITVQQNAGSVTPPAGFTNYLGVTVGAAANVTVGAGDYFFIQQTIEGYNIADFGFGASGASTITFSFWVRSSITGTFGGCVYNGAGSRTYPFTYAISAANTWEYKTVTVAGDTTGTWNTTNGAGLNLDFSIGTGTTKSGTAGAWAGANYYSATGATKLIETNGATFYITGCQLEVGNVSTPFERRQYGQELLLAQRYYQKWLSGGTYGVFPFQGFAISTTQFQSSTMLQVSMRTTPSTLDTGGSFRLTDKVSSIAVTSIVILGATEAGTPLSVGLGAYVASGLTQFRPYLLTANNDSAAYIGLGAEL